MNAARWEQWPVRRQRGRDCCRPVVAGAMLAGRAWEKSEASLGFSYLPDSWPSRGMSVQASEASETPLLVCPLAVWPAVAWSSAAEPVVSQGAVAWASSMPL